MGRSRRVTLADRDPDVRAALALLVTHALDLGIAGEAADADGLLHLLDAAPPDLLLLDWGLNDEHATGRLPTLRTRWPQLRIVVLDGRAGTRTAALAAGATAFICKADAPAQALRALRAVCAELAG